MELPVTGRSRSNNGIGSNHLPEGPQAILAKLRGAIEEARLRAIADMTKIEYLPVPSNDPHALAAALGGLDAHAIDGVAIMAPETPQLRDAIRWLKQEGLPVVAIVSDLPNCERDAFAGIDDVAAGRTAGFLLGRFIGRRPGKVLVLAGSMLAHDHVERRLGFDRIIGAEFEHLDVLPSIEGWDDAETVARLLPAALDAHPDVLGVYCLGAGNQALGEVLKNRNIGQGLVTILHELTPHTRAALRDGTFDAVIAQDFGHVVRSAIRTLQASSDGLSTIPSQEQIGINVVLKENFPSEAG